MRRVRTVAAAAVLGAVLQTVGPAAQDQPKSVSEEYLLLGNPNRGAGEPQVAIHPAPIG